MSQRVGKLAQRAVDSLPRAAGVHALVTPRKAVPAVLARLLAPVPGDPLPGPVERAA